jgi:hypothetical protein
MLLVPELPQARGALQLTVVKPVLIQEQTFCYNGFMIYAWLFLL